MSQYVGCVITGKNSVNVIITTGCATINNRIWLNLIAWITNLYLCVGSLLIWDGMFFGRTTTLIVIIAIEIQPS